MERLSRSYFLLFLGPALVLFIGFLLTPVLTSFWTALHGPSDHLGSGTFIGIGNFSRLLTDTSFLHAFGLLFLFTLITAALEIIVGLSIAIYLDQFLKVSTAVQLLLALPMFVIPVVSGLTFRLLLDASIGILPAFASWWHASPPDMLGEPILAFASIVAQDVWRQWPFVFLIVFAGLKSMPREPLEAIRLDGASHWQALRFVILPSLSSTIMIASSLKVIESLKAFTEIFVMTGGGPGESTSVLSLFIVKQLMSFADFGYGAAASHCLLALGLALAIYVSRKTDLPGRPAMEASRS